MDIKTQKFILKLFSEIMVKGDKAKKDMINQLYNNLQTMLLAIDDTIDIKKFSDKIEVVTPINLVEKTKEILLNTPGIDQVLEALQFDNINSLDNIKQTVGDIVIVKLKDKKLKPNFKVALSGKYTTNALLFKIKYPKARITYMNFLEIEKAVLDGVVDAGVLIHESILTYDDKLEVQAELWDIWQSLAGDDLPLPLGGMCLRRSIPLNKAIDYENTLIKAVKVANENKQLLSKMLLQRDLIRVDYNTLQTYLKLYANDDSIQLSQIQYRALNKLYSLGFKYGFYDELIKIEDFLIPSEYKKLRNS